MTPPRRALPPCPPNDICAQWFQLVLAGQDDLSGRMQESQDRQEEILAAVSALTSLSGPVAAVSDRVTRLEGIATANRELIGELRSAVGNVAPRKGDTAVERKPAPTAPCGPLSSIPTWLLVVVVIGLIALGAIGGPPLVQQLVGLIQ